MQSLSFESFGERHSISTAVAVNIRVVAKYVESGWWGVENLSYIPEEVGSSAVQNIGAYGVEVKDVIESVEVFDFEQGGLSFFSKEECCYGYRDSIFKRLDCKKYIVTAVNFVLQKKGVPNFLYKQLGALFSGESFVELSRIRETVIGIRRFVSVNTRNKNWGKGFIDAVSEQLRKELPGLRGFSAASLRKMRTFYEEWQMLSDNSFVETNELATVQFKIDANSPICYFSIGSWLLLYA